MAQPDVQACHCHSTEALNQEASSLDLSRQKHPSLLQHVPEPAPHTSLARPQPRVVPGGAARLPAKNHKLSKPKSSRVPGPRAFHNWLGLERQRQMSKPPRTPLPDFWVVGRLWELQQHLEHLSPEHSTSITQQNRVPRPSGHALEGNHSFLFLFQKNISKSLHIRTSLSFSHPSLSHLAE